MYFGIACAAVAFGLASWGISQGASAGPTRPTISTSFDTTSSTPTLIVSVNSSDVPRSEHMNVTIWGNGAHGWTVLSYLVTGPTSDGTVAANMTVDNVATYSQVEATASLSSAEVAIPAVPPSVCPANTSCDLLVGSASS